MLSKTIIFIITSWNLWQSRIAVIRIQGNTVFGLLIPSSLTIASVTSPAEPMESYFLAFFRRASQKWLQIVMLTV